MSKFKVGQRVRVRENIKTFSKHATGYDVVPSMKEQSGTIITLKKNHPEKKEAWFAKENEEYWHESWLQSLSIEDVQTGDTIKDGLGSFAFIPFASEHLVHRTYFKDTPEAALDAMHHSTRTRLQFMKEAADWSLYLPDEVEDEMIEVKGKKYSESTIDLALKAYVK